MDGNWQNWGLADALGSIRAEIKVLKAREAELRRAILSAPGSEDGQEFRVIVRRGTARRFNRDALPAHILEDPRYWTERETVTVVTRALEMDTGQSRPPPAGTPRVGLSEKEEEFDVIEDI